MFDFDIEGIKKDLEGLSIQEKLDAIEGIYDELDNALGEVTDLQSGLNDEYESSVYAPLMASVSSYVHERGWNELVNIEDFVITVNSKPKKVKFWAAWDTHDWAIDIELANFIANDHQRYKALLEIASVLALPYNNGSEEISVIVEENELQDTMLYILSKLCEI